ncbi:copia protein [Tanacetum coccineum]
MTGNRSWLKNFVKKFIGTVRFGNDHFGAIMGYGDYVIGDSVISRVYYVEGLGHNLSLSDNFATLIWKLHLRNIHVMFEIRMASKNKSWLWHRRLNHLNFGTINDLARKDLVRDTMADMNTPANDVPAEQAPAIAPPTRTDDQILPSSKWVPIGKSNCILDVQKSHRNPIFLIVVAILKNTNFFRAFTASSTILAIYIQQFWDTICFNLLTGLYSCRLDEPWLNLHKDILRDALDITPPNDNNPFVAPPTSDAVIKYVNTLGYPSTLRNVSAMFINVLYQPWRAILSMINMCLTGKTAGYDRPRHPVL